MEDKLEIATLAGGCFWCTEAVFKKLKGVEEVIPGYTGGVTKNPTYKGTLKASLKGDLSSSAYEAVCSGQTGHAEAIQIKFDPKVISYEKLLEVFWKLHNPTTLNQQGADIGTQYRSAIFYSNQSQKDQAIKSLQEAERSGIYPDKFVTEIAPATEFYPAESYHKDFYDKNKNSGYCRIIIDPKIQKLYTEFKEKTK